MDSLRLREVILEHVAAHGEVDTQNFASLMNVDHQKVVGAVKCLQALDGVITVELQTTVSWLLSEEAKHIIQVGSNEAIVYQNVPPEGIKHADLLQKVPPSIHTIGISKAIVHGWIYIDKSAGEPVVRRKVNNAVDIVKETLLCFASDPGPIPANVKQGYKKRKLVQEVITKSFIVGKGVDFNMSVSKPETDLTPEMIANGSWKKLYFKPYNFNAQGVPPPGGTLHPLLKVRAEFRQIFLEMGFTEMPTNNYVESSFWNFDALFQPQQHPARDAHDTFFIAEPELTTTFPISYLEKVKQVHSSGGFGSQGYGYDWKIEDAQKNLLRTHTTAVSAKMLYKLAQNGFRPAKYFSIDRVFRNETLDATHLAEFHQVEGVVADYNLTLGDLIGTLHEFFSKLGLTKLTFKPAYNPYTEPSMEIFSFHPGLNKYIEVGNSGLFRPEMLLPMGLPENVNVIAWGLSLERPTMIKYGINNIRTLVGPKVDLEMVYASPICRLDKMEVQPSDALESLKDRLEAVITRLHNFDQNLLPQQQKDHASPVEAVITADPQYPPFAVFVLLKLMGSSVSGSIHIHSTGVSVPASINNLTQALFRNSKGTKQLNIKFIWKAFGKIPSISVIPYRVSLMGEINIARYLACLLEEQTNSAMTYKKSGPIFSCQIDNWLDLLYGSVVHGDEKKIAAALKKLDTVLSQNPWLLGLQPTLADICWWSVIKSLPTPNLPPALLSWFGACNAHKLFTLE